MYHMRHSRLSIQLRAVRQARGLTQAALAARGGTSRVTVARFEAGSDQDVRLGTLLRLCQALGLELAAINPGGQAALEARLAREQEQTRRLDRRHRHAALAARLLALPDPKAAQMIVRARANVDRWERDGRCSRHYITRWRRRLSGPVHRVAQSLLRHDSWTDALFQSSPWAFALEPAGA